jgi:pimeloyl-ACP methyl ester carboxylesterase
MFGSTLLKIRQELVLLVSLVVLLVVLHEYAHHQKSGVNNSFTVKRFCLSDSFHTPVLQITNIESTEKKGVAILVHGFQCNKSMMAQLGKYLATQGLEVYAIDLPGHGESQMKYTQENNYKAAKQAVEEIDKVAEGSNRQIILIGHSWGSMVLGPVALERLDTTASIYIGPGYVKDLNPDRPRNVLIITAEHDYEFVKAAAQKSFDELTGRDKSKPGDKRFGDMAAGTARAWEEVPQTAHVSLLFSDDVYRKVREWAEQALQTKLSTSDTFSTMPAKLDLVIVLILCAVFASLISKIIPVNAKGDRSLPRNWLRTFLFLGYGILCGTVVVKYFAPLRFLHLMEGETLASLIFTTGMLASFFYLILERRLAVPSASEVMGDIVVALFGFCALYFSLVFAAEQDFFHVELSFGRPGRILAFATIALCSLPFSLLAERLMRQVQGAFRKFLLGVIGSSLFATIFYAMFPLSFLVTGNRLFRFTEVLLATMGYCAFIGAIFYGNRKSILPGAVFTSLVVAWMISVSFIYY